MKKPLAAFWWHGKPNFGDALNPDIISYVSRREVRWARAGHAEIVGFGSIFHMVRKAVLEAKNPVYVWGAGLMQPLPTDFVKYVAFQAVRGPITSSLLGLDSFVAMGDPGLLAPEALDVQAAPIKQWKYGIIPHISQADLPIYTQLHQTLPNSKVINLLTNDVRRTLKEISACEIILSASLHGLIVADALEIPNIWLEPQPLNKQSRFKFFDYALSIGREMAAPVTINAALALPEISEIPTGYFKNISAVKANIIKSFPAELAV